MDDIFGDLVVDLGVFDDAFVLGDVFFGGFELGFDEGDEEAVGLEEVPEVGEDFF